ncbi:MAG: transglutaminase [Gammaproteobacteria bacterium]|nr:transglutaminase [Gammaproteobacteria bacterium]|tara:strand:+ start:3486 stop:4373 length:888 start_codon:yes stop_codon:yes gene_type:complete
MLYDVRHETRFKYASPVTISHQLLKLRPRRSSRQNVVSTELDVTPHPFVQREWTDYFGNAVQFLTVQEAHRELVIASISRVEVLPGMNIMLDFSPGWEVVAQSMQSPTNAEALSASQFCFESPYVDVHDDLRQFALKTFTPGRPLLDATMALTSRIYEEFTYQGGVTDVSTPVRRVLELKKGVCQDFAHLQIACLRAIGLPARYVSGYLMTHPPEGKEKLQGADESHAWLSVWCPELGWVDFDPTNNLIPNLEHVTIGWGRDYGDVSPVSGFIFGGGKHEVAVGVDVVPTTASVA